MKARHGLLPTLDLKVSQSLVAILIPMEMQTQTQTSTPKVALDLTWIQDLIAVMILLRLVLMSGPAIWHRLVQRPTLNSLAGSERRLWLPRNWQCKKLLKLRGGLWQSCTGKGRLVLEPPISPDNAQL